MYQEIEIVKARSGTLVEELRQALKAGENLIGEKYLQRMKDLRVLGDVSFVTELGGSVYLISYYHFESERPQNPPPIQNDEIFKKYINSLEPFFKGSEPIRIPVANSFWIDTVIKEKIG